MIQYAPALIMLVITLIVAGAFLLPLFFRKGGELLQFYWKGFWMFLALIAFVAGGSQVLVLLGMQVEPYDLAILTGILSAYIFFVVFAWFRLVGFAVLSGIRKINA